MKRVSSRFAFLTILVASLALPAPAADAPEDGFQRIFNGKDLTGWDGDPDIWSVEDGVIRGQSTEQHPVCRNTFLIWRDGTLADFELRLSFRIRNGNAGVQVRSRDGGNWMVSGYQAEVAPGRGAMGLFYDERGRGVLATAGQKVRIDAGGRKLLVGTLGDPTVLRRTYKENDWNEMTVIGRGNRLRQRINGVLYSEVIDEQAGIATTTGILALQVHAGPPMLVEYKDIRLKTLPRKEEKVEVVSLFNGKDLTGWRVVDQYDFQWHGKVYAEDGVIHIEEGMPMSGIGWEGEFPKENYEISLEAMRTTGFDFFCGMTFPVGDSWVTLICGGWGGWVVGLSNIDDYNASENLTTKGMEFDSKRWYRIRVRMTDKIEVWIDGDKVIEVNREGHVFAVWEEQSPIKPFGIATWQTGSALRNITLRKFGD
jgi:hypothetical protein